MVKVQIFPSMQNLSLKTNYNYFTEIGFHFFPNFYKIAIERDFNLFL